MINLLVAKMQDIGSKINVLETIMKSEVRNLKEGMNLWFDYPAMLRGHFDMLEPELRTHKGIYHQFKTHGNEQQR